VRQIERKNDLSTKSMGERENLKKRESERSNDRKHRGRERERQKEQETHTYIRVSENAQPAHCKHKVNI